MSITAIIVNFNAGDTLRQCVIALLNSTQHARVCVVDNASTDDSTQNLQSLYGNRQGVEFVLNATNLGFATAVNAMARHCKSDYLLILNPDCILEIGALEQLLKALEGEPQAVLAGPAIHDENGLIQRATVRRFPAPGRSLMTATGLWRLGRWFPALHGIEVDVSTLGEEPSACDAVSGACMLIKRQALEAVGFLDEGYFMHCEDLDLMYRFADKGWHCLYVPRAIASHQQGLSSRSRLQWVHFQKHRGMARFFKKFQAPAASLPFKMLVYTGIWLRFVVLWPTTILKS